MTSLRTVSGTLIILYGTLAGCTHREAATGPLDNARIEPLLQAIARHEDRVRPEQLADWIIQDRKDFALVDVRDPEDYRQGHIEDALHVPVVQLLDTHTLATLPKDRKLVVYSNGSEDGAKAEVLLRLAGRQALVLEGGYNAWQKRVLHPDLKTLDEERLVREKRRAIACYFSPQRAAAAPPRPFKPRLSPVPAVPGQAKPPTGLITEEGC